MTTGRTRDAHLILVLIITIVGRFDLTDGADMVHRILGKSFEHCKNECANRTLCSSVSYKRRYSICELYSIDVNSRSVLYWNHGSGVLNTDVPKTNDFLTLQKQKCFGCETTHDCYIRGCESDGVCEVNMCGPPEYILGARLLGNMNSVGSNRMYICRAPFTDRQEVSTCGEDGGWSPVTISCTNCTVPEVTRGTVTVSWMDDDTYEARVECDAGYILRDAGTPTCLTVPGLWNHTLLNLTCCDRADVPPWRLIYRLNSGFSDTISGSFRLGNGFYNNTLQDGCQFRDDSFISLWTMQEIYRVKLELIKDDVVVAYMMFDGQWGSNERDWMSIDRLLDSSWPDLMAKKQAGDAIMLSFNGITQAGDIRRFVVAESLSDTRDECDMDFGWMYVTKSAAYPCHTTVTARGHPGARIVYSGQGSTKLEEGSVEFADKLEISVEISDLESSTDV